MDKDLVYKKHIKDSIEYIEKFLKNKVFEDFVNDRMMQNAVVRELEIVGEAVKRLSSYFKEHNSQIEWIKIGGMRDRLVHDYFKIDYKIVWNTVHDDLPKLKAALES